MRQVMFYPYPKKKKRGGGSVFYIAMLRGGGDSLEVGFITGHLTGL